jgi:ribosome biogenesis GTPase
VLLTDKYLTGRVIRTQSGFFTVETEKGLLVTQLRGRLKRGPRTGDVVALGDWVEITPQDDATGMIETIRPRRSMISRLAPTPRGEYEQVLIANPDQAVMVFACAEPEPRLGMLDRFLVIAEEQQVPAVVVANKVDLVGVGQAHDLFDRYSAIGYPVLYTSAKTGEGVELFHDRLAGQVSILMGPSGAGKSSLLNRVQPDLGLAVREVSQATSKGRHTTVFRELFPLEGGGYVADTPGLKALALWDIEPEELDGYFPELRDLVADCQFSDCTHLHEPGCAVLAAVEQGEIHPQRYQSYVRMRQGEEAVE